MSRDFGRLVAWLNSLEPRMYLSDLDLVEMFWRAHPRFNFFKSLPWGANLLDIGAGNGGLVYWKDWLKPQRADLNLYGVDRNVGEHRDLYAGWEAVDLDAAPPSFPAVKLNAFFASHVIEYLSAPERLVQWLATTAEPGARLYLEWTSPATLDLPTREQLHKFDVDVVTSNFVDDWEHKQAPDLPTVGGWLSACGFEVMSSGAVDTGIVGAELFARGGDPHMRSMGYWSLTHSSLYAVAVRTDQPVAAIPGPASKPATAWRAEFANPPSSAPRADPTASLELLHAKRALLRSGLFDAGFYRETYADIRRSLTEPLTHYIMRGEAEGRSPNPVFAPGYYRRHAMAEAPAEQNALVHYAEEGERLGRKPHPAFDPQTYLAANPPLAEFVDRPLFHFLTIGRAASLPVTPGASGEALARILEAQPHASDFEYSQRRNHYELMRYKQALVRELGIEEGFAFYKEMFALPDSDRIARKRVTSLYEFAKEHGASFHEIAPAGMPFEVPPPRVIGEGNHRAHEGTTRANFVACLTNARVRARSGFIDAAGVALLDYQANELARIDDELDFDPAVFHAEDGAVWMIVPEEEAAIVELEEAFMLLGPHSDGFGHWMLDLLPRYIAASTSGVLPPIPVLIDANMPPPQRQCLELMLTGGAEIIALPSLATARVRRLWCASGQAYISVLGQVNDRFRWDYETVPPARFAPLAREMDRRIETVTSAETDQDRVFLARKSFLRHKLVNTTAVEAAVSARGFAVVHPEDLSFAEQVRLLRQASWVVGPVGSAMFLMVFAKPGTKLFILCHRYTISLQHLTGFMSEIGIEVTVLTGPSAHIDEEFPEQSDFEIEEVAFCDELDRWLEPR
jgi:capsular polysaccharide biosynthesis protein